jgi:hypothetical protein
MRARFHANDNIAARLRDGELDALQSEVRSDGSGAALSASSTSIYDDNTRDTARRIAKMFAVEERLQAVTRPAARHGVPQRRASWTNC